MDTNLAANIRAQLKKQAKTQGDLALALGISRMSIHRRLTGQAEFKASELTATAAFLGVPAGSLLGDNTQAA